jgi:hypothetical protein
MFEFLLLGEKTMMYLVIRVNGKEWLSTYKTAFEYTLTHDKAQALHFNSDYADKFFNTLTTLCQTFLQVEVFRVRG